MNRLRDRVALVTGAAAGIGEATARLFAEEGAAVFLADIDGSTAERVASEIRTTGADATAVACDVSKGQDVTALFRTIESAMGQQTMVA